MSHLPPHARGDGGGCGGVAGIGKRAGVALHNKQGRKCQQSVGGTLITTSPVGNKRLEAGSSSLVIYRTSCSIFGRREKWSGRKKRKEGENPSSALSRTAWVLIFPSNKKGLKNQLLKTVVLVQLQV